MIDDFIALNAGTLKVRNDDNVTLETNRGIELRDVSELIVDTGNTDVDNKGRNLYYGGTISASVSTANLTISGATGNAQYLPTLILTGNTNSFEPEVNISRGVTLQLNDVTFGSTINLSGDLKGTGTVMGDVVSTGGRINPGDVIDGTALNISGDLTLDSSSTLYFGFENDVADLITVGGSATIDGQVIVVPYNMTGTAGNYNLITTTGGVTLVASTVFSLFTNYTDDNDATTDGTFTPTTSGVIDGNNYVLRSINKIKICCVPLKYKEHNTFYGNNPTEVQMHII